MRAKLIKVRVLGVDQVFLAVLLVPGRVSEARRLLLQHAGAVGRVLLSDVSGTAGSASLPEQWENAPMRRAHRYVQDNFDTLDDGSIIDTGALKNGGE